MPVRSKWTSRSACRPSRWSACRTRACARAATACAARSATPASSFRRTGSPSTSRRPTSARRARRSICRSRWASWPPPGSSRGATSPTSLLLGELSLDGGDSAGARRAADRRRGAARRSRRLLLLPAATPPRRRSSTGLRLLRGPLARRGGRRAERPGRLAGVRAADAACRCRRRGRRRRADFADVRGQALARRALEIAAAGGHNLLLIGPPGAGKTMMARRRRRDPAAADVRRGARGDGRSTRSPGCCRPARGCCAQRPFRAPHHTISDVALVGGGQHAAARRDQPRAPRRAVPRRDARVQPARARSAAPAARGRASCASRAPRGPRSFPARFMLVGGDESLPVRLSPAIPSRRAAARRRRSRATRSRLSGPLRDRIDLTVEVARGAGRELQSERLANRPATIRARVVAARERQTASGRRAECAAARARACAPRALDATRGRASLRRDGRRSALSARGLRPRAARRAHHRRPRRRRADVGGSTSPRPCSFGRRLAFPSSQLCFDHALRVRRVPRSFRANSAVRRAGLSAHVGRGSSSVYDVHDAIPVVVTDCAVRYVSDASRLPLSARSRWRVVRHP